MEPEPLTSLLPRLRAERGWSRERLSHEAFNLDETGTSAAQISAIERGKRYPSARTMLALAKAMELEPTVFAEYRLSISRLTIDERRVGLKTAIENLEGTNLEQIAKDTDPPLPPNRGR